MNAKHYRSGYLRACDRVQDLLSKFGIQRAPVPIHDICQAHGLRVVTGGTGVRRGLLDRSSSTIRVAPFPQVRQRFYIAHEFAHFVLPKHYGEASCSTFASCLLIPHEWIIEDLRTMAPNVLAGHYEVTWPVMQRRLRLGGLDAIQTELPF